jgi:hypothetical protein
MADQHLTDQRDHALPARRPGTNDASSAGAEAPAHPLLTLQRQVGNASIARMLAQREAMPDEEDDMLQARHDPAIAQRAAVPDEEEDMLQARHDPAIAQREELPSEEEEEEDMLQARHDPAIAQREAMPDEEDDMLQASPEVGLEGGPVSDSLASRIDSQRGQGAPLSGAMRDSMESAFGTSFEDVRVHSGNESNALNQSISAKAFTTGSDVFLGKDSSASDQNLMAHELTHVVQQRSMPGTGGGMQVGPAGDSHEQQADAIASAVTSGQATPQRKPDEQP